MVTYFWNFLFIYPLKIASLRFLSLHTRRRRLSETGYNVCFFCKIYPLHIQLLHTKAPSPLSNVKPFHIWKHLTERRRRFSAHCWLYKQPKSTTRAVLICPSTLNWSAVSTSTTFFRWLITDSRTAMPCETPKCSLPCTMKLGNSFLTIIATTIAVSRKTASDGRRME